MATTLYSCVCQDGPVRRFLTVLLCLVALLATQAALLCAWIGHTVVSSSGFSSLISQAQQDPAVQGAVKDYARTAVADQLITTVPFLQGLRTQIEDASESALSGIVSDPGYPQAFRESVMSYHDSAFSADHTPVLSLKPVTALVMEKVASPFGVQAPAGFDLSVPMPTAELFGQNLFALLAQVSLLWKPLAFIAGLAAVLALLASRRRPLTLGVLGALTALLGWGCTFTAPEALASIFSLNAEPGLPTVLLSALGRSAGTQMAQQAWNVVWAGGAAVVLALLWAAYAAMARRSGSHSYAYAGHSGSHRAS